MHCTVARIDRQICLFRDPQATALGCIQASQLMRVLRRRVGVAGIAIFNNGQELIAAKHPVERIAQNEPLNEHELRQFTRGAMSFIHDDGTSWPIP